VRAGGDRREVITFDGPAASGKSSVAQRVARALDLPFVSSGLLYRVATHLVNLAAVDPRDEAAVMRAIERHTVTLAPESSGNRVFVDGEEVSARLHTDRVDEGVSLVAAQPWVRTWVSGQLREVPAPFTVDGRDMGSTVFPEARHKFYLTASPQERARRRVGERSADLAAVAAAISRRDALDAKQLAPAPDAHHLDTDGIELDAVVARVLTVLAECGRRADRADAACAGGGGA
jgi:CMP/dCMP kinase